MRFRPDVTLFSSTVFFPCLTNALVTEDFAYAMHDSAREGGKERAQFLAHGALFLAALHADDLRPHPVGFIVELINPEDRDRVPLLMSRTSCGKPILGVLSDACPETKT